MFDRNSLPAKQLQDHFKKIEQGFEASKDGETLFEKLLYSLSPESKKKLLPDPKEGD